MLRASYKKKKKKKENRAVPALYQPSVLRLSDFYKF